MLCSSCLIGEAPNNFASLLSVPHRTMLKSILLLPTPGLRRNTFVSCNLCLIFQASSAPREREQEKELSCRPMALPSDGEILFSLPFPGI